MLLTRLMPVLSGAMERLARLIPGFHQRLSELPPPLTVSLHLHFSCNLVTDTRPLPAMTIFIKTLDGRSMTFEVKPTETVDRLKKLIEERQNIAPDMQRLLFGGKQLEDGKTLQDYNIGPDATGHLSEKMNMSSHDSGLTIAAQ